MAIDLETPGAWYAPSPGRYPSLSYDSLILVPTATYSRDLLTDAKNCLRDQVKTGWTLQPEDETGKPANPLLTPLLAHRPQHPSPDDPVRRASDLVPLLRTYGVRLAGDLIFAGAPAGKPNAVTRGDFGRVPVSVAFEPPPLPTQGRRPRVALLDSEIATGHPWLGPPGADGFWIGADAYGWNRGAQRPRDDRGISPFQTLSAYFGHGTFSAGIIRQAAPAARVVLIPVMDEDGVAHADHVINALGWLAEKIQETPGFVDVVCLPLTLDARMPEDECLLAWLRTACGALGELGVPVVVAAGNDGRSAPTYPGVFTTTSPQPKQGLICVGALNSNGASMAYFSNFGAWVTAWEVGSSVISAIPQDDGAAMPELWISPEQLHDRQDVREALAGQPIGSEDPDRFCSGTARWSGTSFAAARHAARLARGITDR